MERPISQAMQRVALVVERVGVTALAQEAGIDEGTIRAYRRRGWSAASLTICDALIAAAERIDLQEAGRARAGH